MSCLWLLLGLVVGAMVGIAVMSILIIGKETEKDSNAATLDSK